MVGVNEQAVVRMPSPHFVHVGLAFPNVDQCTHFITSCFRCFLVPKQLTNRSSTKASRHNSRNMHANSEADKSSPLS